jgi:hypothetical protein
VVARGVASRGALVGAVVAVLATATACGSSGANPVFSADVVQPGLTSDLEVLSGLMVTPSQLGHGWTSRATTSSDAAQTGVTALGACAEDVASTPAPESSDDAMLTGGGSWMANKVLVYTTPADAQTAVTSFANGSGSSVCNPALGQGSASNPQYVTEGLPILVTWLSGAACMVENKSTGSMAAVILQRRGRFVSIIYGPVDTRDGAMYDASTTTLNGASAATYQLGQLTQTVSGG